MFQKARGLRGSRRHNTFGYSKTRVSKETQLPQVLRKLLLWLENWLKYRKEMVRLVGCLAGWKFHFKQSDPWRIHADTGYIKYLHQRPGEECAERNL